MQEIRVPRSCLEKGEVPPSPTNTKGKNQRPAWDWKKETLMAEKY